MYVCVGVTCHLHFWQNDRSLLRATTVTRGWKGHRIRVSTQADSGEDNYPDAPAGIRTRNLSITNPELLPTSYRGSGKGTTFPCDVSDLCAAQRSRIRGYDNSLPRSFKFSSTAAFLKEWIRSIIFTLYVT